jgi:regulator of nucleoside diphosphate kinase
MFTQFLPTVTLSASDRERLERVAFVAAEDHHPTAPFLLSELCRAEILPDGAAGLEAVVGMNCWVNYRLNWGSSVETQRLVYPEEYVSADEHVSVLSPVGTALLGLRPGSQMPYFTSAGWMHVVRIESVSPSGPNVIPLFLRGRNAAAACDPSAGDDPGPAAA